jgi:K+-sensing histidine kinase KdpD
VTKSSFEGDPVIDFALGKGAAGLSFPGGVGLAFVACLGLAAIAATGAIPGDVAFAGFLLVVVATAWWSAPATGVVVALVGFLFVNGFALDSNGTLAWHGESDLLRLVSMVALAVTVSVLGNLRAERQQRTAALDRVNGVKTDSLTTWGLWRP